MLAYRKVTGVKTQHFSIALAGYGTTFSAADKNACFD